jgi:excisionase family DNA binding protein
MFLSLDELAIHLNLPRNYLRHLADGGGIPCLRPGGRRRFDAEAVRAALGQRATGEEGLINGDD